MPAPRAPLSPPYHHHHTTTTTTITTTTTTRTHTPAWRPAPQALRESGVPYCVVRPTGLKFEGWPQGRPFLSQGDVAVGGGGIDGHVCILNRGHPCTIS